MSKKIFMRFKDISDESQEINIDSKGEEREHYSIDDIMKIL